MEPSIKNNSDKRLARRRKLFLLLGGAAILLLLALSSLWASSRLNRSLYDERVINANKLMTKMTQNVETGMNSRWELAHFIAEDFSRESYDSIEDAVERIGKVRRSLEEMNMSVCIVDLDGICYASTGLSFRWEKTSMLISKQDECYISTLKALNRSGPQIFFLVKLEKPVMIEKNVITHVCLICNVSDFDRYFDMDHYSDSSAAFVIHSNGTTIYRQEKQNEISAIYNIISALERADFDYDGSAEKIKDDLQNGRSGTMRLSLDGRKYYALYGAMSINDWNALLMIPEEYVGVATGIFMKTILTAIGVVSLVVFGALVAISGWNSYRIFRKHDEINRRLHDAAEKEREANSVKTRFLYAMSHDIRTPLNVVAGMVELARKHLDEPKRIEECLDRIDLASAELLKLLDDIPNISEGGRIEDAPESGRE